MEKMKMNGWTPCWCSLEGFHASASVWSHAAGRFLTLNILGIFQSWRLSWIQKALRGLRFDNDVDTGVIFDKMLSNLSSSKAPVPVPLWKGSGRWYPEAANILWLTISANKIHLLLKDSVKSPKSMAETFKGKSRVLWCFHVLPHTLLFIIIPGLSQQPPESGAQMN